MTPTPWKRQEYWARINRAIDYIDGHLGEDLKLEAIAAAAHFSPYHFHRLFKSMVGETVSQFVQRVRLERAASQLLADRRKSITRIAMDCGYGSSAAFSRAFRIEHGVSPSEWRRRFEAMHATDGASESNLGKQESKDGIADRKESKDQVGLEGYPGVEGRSYHQEGPGRSPMTTFETLDVRVEEMPETHVAYVRHVGPYKGDEALFKDLFNRLWMWAGSRNLINFPDTKAIIVYHDHPDITDEDKLRTSVCITVPEDTKVSGEVGKMALAEGTYAMARFELAGDEYEAAWEAVYGQWLPESGFQPVDKPAFELYLSGPDQHPEGKFVLEICVPVRPL